MANDVIRINALVVQSHKTNFSNNYTMVKGVRTKFNSSYVSMCGNSYIVRMKKKINELFNTVNSGYSSIETWLQDYNADIMNVEKAVVNNTPSIVLQTGTRGIIKAKISELPSATLPSVPYLEISKKGTSVNISTNLQIDSNLYGVYDPIETSSNIVASNNITTLYGSHRYQEEQKRKAEEEAARLAAEKEAEEARKRAAEAEKNKSWGEKIIDGFAEVGDYLFGGGYAEDWELTYGDGGYADRYIVEPTKDFVEDQADSWYYGFYELYNEETGIYAQTGRTIIATPLTVLTGLGEGTLSFFEGFYDTGVLINGGVGYAILSLYDLGQDIGSCIFGTEPDYLAKDWLNGAMLEIKEEKVKNLVDQGFADEDNKYTQFLKENTLYFEETRAISTEIGRYLPAIIVTGGVQEILKNSYIKPGMTPMEIATATKVATGHAVLTSTVLVTTSSTGKGTETALNNGADNGEAAAYGILNGLWEGGQFWLGSKIASFDKFGSAWFKSMNPTAAKAANVATRIGLDGLTGAAEGGVRPAMDMIYNDLGYGESFEQNGSWENVWYNTMVAVIGSAGGEALDLSKMMRNVDDPNVAEFNAKYTEYDAKMKELTDAEKIEYDNYKKAIEDGESIVYDEKYSSLYKTESELTALYNKVNNTPVSKVQDIKNKFEAKLSDIKNSVEAKVTTGIEKFKESISNLSDNIKKSKISKELQSATVKYNELYDQVIKTPEDLANYNAYKAAMEDGNVVTKIEYNEDFHKLVVEDHYVKSLIDEYNNFKLNNPEVEVKSSVELSNKVEAAIYFNDPNQFMYQTIYNYCQQNNIDITDFNAQVGGKASKIDIEYLTNTFNQIATPNEQQILNKLKSGAREFTQLELDVIASYTKSTGPVITAFLRDTDYVYKGKKVPIKDWKKLNNIYNEGWMKSGVDAQYIDIEQATITMDNIINNSPPLTENLTVYRKVNDLFFDNNKIELSDLKPGTVFNDKAFVSTSVVESNLFNDVYSYSLEIELPAGTKGAYIETATGTGFYGQQELLLGRNCNFEITAEPVMKEIQVYDPDAQQWVTKTQVVIKAKLVENIYTTLDLNYKGKRSPINYIDQVTADLTETIDSVKNSIKNTELADTTNQVAKNNIPNDAVIQKLDDSLQIDKYNALYNTKNGVELSEFKNTLEDSGLLDRFNKEVADMDANGLYNNTNNDTWEHGVEHVQDVMLYSMYMGYELDISSAEMDLLVEAAKYHDSAVYLGRTGHATNSAEIAKQNLSGKYTEADINKIAAIIEYHEVPDNVVELQKICKKYNIPDAEMESVSKLCDILKDADALDRTRFRNNLNEDYLRNDAAVDLVKTSYQMQELRGVTGIEEGINNGTYSKQELALIEYYRSQNVPDYVIYSSIENWDKLGYRGQNGNVRFISASDMIAHWLNGR